VSSLVYPSADTDAPLAGWGNPPGTEQLYPLNISTNAYAASLVVKSGPGIFYGFTAYNSNASAQFILVFDASTLPGNGAIPAAVFTVAGSNNLGVNWIPGRTFHTGIVVCNSSTGPTKTIGSADCWFDCQYV
jgi:hypothetical protein